MQRAGAPLINGTDMDECIGFECRKEVFCEITSADKDESNACNGGDFNWDVLQWLEPSWYERK